MKPGLTLLLLIVVSAITLAADVPVAPTVAPAAPEAGGSPPMNQGPTPEMIAKFHQWFAVECNNRAWDLAVKLPRTAEETREMLDAAYAASFHWAKIGKPVNIARADMTLAHIWAVLGNGEQAQKYAKQCLDFFEANHGEEWDIAFAHAEMAYAAYVRGDHAAHVRHHAEADRLGQAMKSEEDKSVFMEEFSRIPKPPAKKP